MITSTLLLDSVLVVLFGYGSDDTFIAQTFVSRIGIGLEDLGYDLVVITPAETIFTTRECMRGVVVTQWHILFTYFTVLPM